MGKNLSSLLTFSVLNYKLATRFPINALSGFSLPYNIRLHESEY